MQQVIDDSKKQLEDKGKQIIDSTKQVASEAGKSFTDNASEMLRRGAQAFSDSWHSKGDAPQSSHSKGEIPMSIHTKKPTFWQRVGGGFKKFGKGLWSGIKTVGKFAAQNALPFVSKLLPMIL